MIPVFHPREMVLLRFAEGSAPEPDRRRVAAHLAHCERCRRAIQSTRTVREAFAIIDAQAPSALWGRIVLSRASGERMVLPIDDAFTLPVDIIERARRLGVLGVLAAAVALIVFRVVRQPNPSPAATTTLNALETGAEAGLALFAAPLAAQAVATQARFAPVAGSGSWRRHSIATSASASRAGGTRRFAYRYVTVKHNIVTDSGASYVLTVTKLPTTVRAYRLEFVYTDAKWNAAGTAPSLTRGDSVTLAGPGLAPTNLVRWQQRGDGRWENSNYSITDSAIALHRVRNGLLHSIDMYQPNPFDTTYRATSSRPGLNVTSLGEMAAVLPALPFKADWRGSVSFRDIPSSRTDFPIDLEVAGKEVVQSLGSAVPTYRLKPSNSGEAFGTIWVRQGDGVMVRQVIGKYGPDRTELVLTGEGK